MPHHGSSPRRQIIRISAALEPGRDQVLACFLYVAGFAWARPKGCARGMYTPRGEVAVVTVNGKGGKTRHILLTPTITRDLAALRVGASDDERIFQSRTG